MFKILVKCPTVRRSNIFTKNAPVKTKLMLHFVCSLLICFIKLLCSSFSEKRCLIFAKYRSLGCVTPTHRRGLARRTQLNIAVCLIQTNEFKEWSWKCVFRYFQGLKSRSLNIRSDVAVDVVTQLSNLLLLLLFFFFLLLRPLHILILILLSGLRPLHLCLHGLFLHSLI